MYPSVDDTSPAFTQFPASEKVSGGDYPGIKFETIEEIAERLHGKTAPSKSIPKKSLCSEDPITIGGFELSAVGLLIPENAHITFEQYQQAVDRHWIIDNGRAWAAGDLLLYGEKWFSEIYQNAFDIFKYNPRTLDNKRWICNRFPYDKRINELSFSHHAIVAKYNDEVVYTLLGIAAERHLSADQLTELKREYDRLVKAGNTAGADDEPEKAKNEPKAIKELASLPLKPSDFSNHGVLHYELPDDLVNQIYEALYREGGHIRLVIIEES